MSEKILVKKPMTYNGRDVVLDDSGKIMYKDTIVMATAKRSFEKMNDKLPPALRYVIEPYPALEAKKTK